MRPFLCEDFFQILGDSCFKEGVSDGVRHKVCKNTRISPVGMGDSFACQVFGWSLVGRFA